nr:poly [ADP-ribose] polymerase 2-like [Ipomoea batatas]
MSKSTISKGYDVLKRIADVINQSDRKMLKNLSSEFYTVISHDFGYIEMHWLLQLLMLDHFADGVKINVRLKEFNYLKGSNTGYIC